MRNAVMVMTKRRRVITSIIDTNDPMLTFAYLDTGHVRMIYTPTGRLVAFT